MEDDQSKQKHWQNLAVKHLILESKDFIVFIDHENDLEWITTDEYDLRVQTDNEKSEFNSVLNDVAKAESIPCYELNDKIIVAFKRQIGEGIVRALDKDFMNAKHMIKLAQEFIVNRNVEQSRYMYLLASSVTSGAVTCIGFLLWLIHDFAISIIGETGFFSLLAFFAGAMGAFLSIILRMGKTNLDYNASKSLHYVEASSRIIAGMISGLLIGFCIKCGIFFSVFSKVDSTHLAMVIGGLIGGGSERLAPSIIKKLDNSK